jgi:AAA domain/Homeodomain-like domain
MMLTTLADLASVPRWVAWRTEPQRATGRITKVPKNPHTLRDAASTRPETWGTRQQAEAADKRLPASLHGTGGVGLVLGEAPDGFSIGGVDLDSCRGSETGELEPWACDVLTMLNTYAEVSPSGTGVKAFFCLAPDAVSALRQAKLLDRDGYGRSFKRGTGGDHPPAIEVHLGARYYAVTDDRLPNMPAELRQVPSDTIRELLSKVGPFFAKGDIEQAKPDRSARAFRLARQMRSEGKPFTGYVAALDVDPELAMWKKEKGEAQCGRELHRAWDRAGGASIPKSFRILTADDFLREELPQRETILSPWLPSKGLAMIYGPRGIGKTHLTLGCAYAIASGGCFLLWSTPRPRRVLVIDGEMPAATLQERLTRIIDEAKEAPPEPAYWRILPMDLQDGSFDLGNEADQRALEPDLVGVDVIFIDNISTLARLGRENEADSWLPIQEWALEQRRAGRSVVFMHHAGKGGAQRGTSRREDVLDTVIALRRPQDYQADQGARFEVHFEKNRGFYGDDAKSFEAALGAGGWTMRDLADADLARVVVMTSDGMSTRDIAEEIGWSKSKVSRVQAKAREAGLMASAGNA